MKMISFVFFSLYTLDSMHKDFFSLELQLSFNYFCCLRGVERLPLAVLNKELLKLVKKLRCWG